MPLHPLLDPDSGLTVAGGAWLAGLAGMLVLSAALTAWLARVLADRGVLDRPNPRSSHVRPTPRGGGIAILAVLFPAWIAAVITATPPGPWFQAPAVAVATAAALLAILSFIDDLRGLSARLRLVVQLGLIGGLIGGGALPGPVLGGWLPGWLDAAVALLAWAWFINLFNFMDGIDGIAASETIHLGLGIALVAALAGFGAQPVLLGLATAAAAAGFLVCNWHPARIFMGDVGSIPLGLLLGWLLLDLAARGAAAAALILPAVYAADATVTLLLRLRRGETVWQAHRGHFYQRAARRIGHAGTVRWIVGCNVVLLGLAAASLGPVPLAVLGAAAVVTAACLAALHRLAGAPA